MYVTDKKTLAILIGNALEYYDVMLYGFFAVILAPLFFPTDNQNLSLIISMGSIGAAFLARPLGGIVFGHIGDRWGRKDTLSLSIFLVAFPTLGIALLPTYAQVGILAPILLILCRILQGFCLGGETGGAMTYFIENAKKNERDIASSWLVVSCYLGTLVGTLLGSLFTSSYFPDWGWRLTFVIGSLIAFIGYYIRKKLKESPEFLESKKKGKILKVPLIDIFKNEKMNLFFAAGLSSTIIIPFFVVFIYLNSLLTQKLYLEPYLVLILNAGLMILWIVLLPIFGSLAQRYGRRVVMMTGLVGIAVSSYPLFLLAGPLPSFETILLAQIVLSVFAIAFVAPSSAFLVELFPVNERYSGIAFGYSLGHAIFGGLIPLILPLLVHSYELYSAPAAFLCFSAVLGFISLHKGGFLKTFTGIVKLLNV